MTDLLLPPHLSDITVRMDQVPAVLPQATARGVLWQAAPNRFLLDVPELARYWAEGGDRLTIDICQNALKKDVARILNMAPLAALAYQRGYVALHAAVLIRDGKAVLLAGDSGCGKSSLAVEMVRRGWLLYGDELALLKQTDHQQVVALPVAAEAALWPDAMEHMGIRLCDTFPYDANRRQILFSFGQMPKPVLVTGLVSLALHNEGEIVVSEILGAKRFRNLGHHLFQSHIAEVLLDKEVYFSVATSLVRDCRFIGIRRPRGLWSLDELAEKAAAELL